MKIGFWDLVFAVLIAFVIFQTWQLMITYSVGRQDSYSPIKYCIPKLALKGMAKGSSTTYMMVPCEENK